MTHTLALVITVAVVVIAAVALLSLLFGSRRPPLP